MSKRSKFFAGVILTGWPIMYGCGGQKNIDTAAAESQLNIVGGTTVSSALYQSKFTSIASLRYGGSHFCGGTLIAANKILTAAHCLADFSSTEIKNSITVVLGSSSLGSSSGATTFKIAGYKIDSRYDASTSQFDVAVITLNGTSTITPAPINTSTAVPAVGEKTYVAGWGSTQEGGNVSSALKYTTVAVVSNAECTNDYGSDIYFGSLCAFTKNTDSCQGDSGGPLYSYDGTKLTVIGVVSWGNGCAREGYPGVYSRLSEFSPLSM